MANQQDLLGILGQINSLVQGWRGDPSKEALMNLSVRRFEDNGLKKFKLVLLGQPEITLNCIFNCELDSFLVPMPAIENEKNLVFVATVYLEIEPETGKKFFTVNNRKIYQEVFLKNTYDLLRSALEELGFQDAIKVKAKLTKYAKKTNTPRDKPSSEIEVPKPQQIIIISTNDREISF